jgi:hypothetical protein
MKRFFLWITAILVVAACSARADVVSGPLLVNAVTLGPATAILPTRILSATPPPSTPEVLSPLQMITVEGDFVLVTPTLPPSKTPTMTPSQSLTPTQTLTPTTTVTATTTAFLFPTSVIIPVTLDVAIAANEVCASTWFFIQPRPPGCPMNPPNASQGVYQSFQNGYMVWVSSQDAIYILYNDSQLPRWQVYRDYFNEGMAEVVGDFMNPPSGGLWQPRRGFGLLWRSDAVVRDRIGWGTMEYEQPYSVQVQTARDGSLFLSRPDAQVFVLMPSNVNWNVYTGDVPLALPSPIVAGPVMTLPFPPTASGQ